MYISEIDDELIQDRSALIQSLSTDPEYLKNKVSFYLCACGLYGSFVVSLNHLS